MFKITVLIYICIRLWHFRLHTIEKSAKDLNHSIRYSISIFMSISKPAFHFTHTLYLYFFLFVQSKIFLNALFVKTADFFGQNLSALYLKSYFSNSKSAFLNVFQNACNFIFKYFFTESVTLTRRFDFIIERPIIDV